MAWLRRHSLLVLLVWAVLAALKLNAAEAKCENYCSLNGRCNQFNACECYEGYAGGDCSIQLCPKGPSWAIPVSLDDLAHVEQVQCSGRGNCVAGVCQCQPGFEGHNCGRLACNCNGHGKCLTLKQLTRLSPLELHRATTGPPRTYDLWDADMVQGCLCDAGFTGPDCSQKECPKGDDPMTDGQSSEVQLIHCVASGGSLALSFKGETTPHLPSSITAKDLEAALNALSSVRNIKVTYSDSRVGTLPLCTAAGTNVASVTFVNQSSQPLLQAYTTASLRLQPSGAQGRVRVAGTGEAINGVQSAKGSREHAVCAGRGLCDSATGICQCYAGYRHSPSGDCSIALPSTKFRCPGDFPCSGHGVCDSKGQGKCLCFKGWESGDCSERTCPLGRSWYSYPSGDNQAHSALTECSDRGFCDRSTGQCKCMAGFTGTACEKMACATDDAGVTCSSHGRCLSMAELAPLRTVNGVAAPLKYGIDPNNPSTWDAYMIQSCHCDGGHTGYDCSQKLCATGDDPLTTGQVDEVQLLQCNATSGHFKLKFREAQTASLSFSLSAAALTKALQALPTVGRVHVQYIEGSSELCTADGWNVASIAFLTKHADLPALEVENLDLRLETPSVSQEGSIRVATNGETVREVASARGTKENVPCSNRGLCDLETGKCQCFPGFGPSDGTGKIGTIDDCGHSSLRPGKGTVKGK